VDKAQGHKDDEKFQKEKGVPEIKTVTLNPKTQHFMKKQLRYKRFNVDMPELPQWKLLAKIWHNEIKTDCEFKGDKALFNVGNGLHNDVSILYEHRFLGTQLMIINKES